VRAVRRPWGARARPAPDPTVFRLHRS